MHPREKCPLQAVQTEACAFHDFHALVGRQSLAVLQTSIKAMRALALQTGIISFLWLVHMERCVPFSAVGRLYAVAGWMTFADLELVSRIHYLAAMNQIGPSRALKPMPLGQTGLARIVLYCSAHRSLRRGGRCLMACLTESKLLRSEL